jgi:predicted metal-dependent HD superfamily phosphohydrolase
MPLGFGALMNVIALPLQCKTNTAMQDYLHTRWHALTAGKANKQLADKLLVALLRAWNEPQRRYHTQAHLENLLALSHHYRSQLHDAAVVDFAIYYHDAVYKPERRDNEEKSAQRAELELPQLGIDAGTVTKVAAYIRSTAAHGNATHTDNDLNFFLDFDLSILGAEAAVYDLYAFQVREEFSIYPDLLYKPGRAKVLEKLLQQPVYRTTVFRDLYEEAARENLVRELGR